MNLTGRGDPQRLRGFVVSPGLFEALRARPLAGRTFRAEEEEASRDAVVILSHGLWQRLFGGDPRLVGGRIELDALSHTVVGIMLAEFDFPPSAEFWKPLAFTPAQRNIRDARYLLPLARLRDGVTRTQAEAEMHALARRLGEMYPESNAGCSVEIRLLGDYIARERTQQYVRMLTGAALFVLLVCCANVAGLGFARASARQREIAMRLALGARRGRVLRQLLTESVLLALAGAVLGSLAAAWAVQLIRTSMPPELAVLIAGWKTLSVNRRVLALTLAAAVGAGVLAGLWPALRLSRADLASGLRSGGRSVGGRQGARSALVVIQGTLAVVLLAGAALLVKGFAALLVVQPNLEPEKILTFHLSLPEVRRARPWQWAAQHERLLERIRTSVPVSQLAAANTVPYQFVRRRTEEIAIEGQPPPPPQEARLAQAVMASPAYFETLRIPLLAGRAFAAQDREQAPPVAIVSEALVRRYFAGQDPLGKRIRAGGPWLTIVGMAADVRDGPFDRQIWPVPYRPYAQAPVREMVYALRGRGDALALAPLVRAAIAAVDPDQPIFDVMSMQKRIANRTIAIQFAGTLMSVLGALALMLAAVGLYGVTAYAVAERTQEIGLRMALGARPSVVLREVLGRGLALACLSAVLGAGCAFVLGRLLASLIFGVSPSDPLVLIAVPTLLVLVALVACWAPARRAARVDPVIALRSGA